MSDIQLITLMTGNERAENMLEKKSCTEFYSMRLVDNIRHHLYEYPYCHICETQTLDEQMNDCKATVLAVLALARDCDRRVARIMDRAAGRI
jgi:hypothetical protein